MPLLNPLTFIPAFIVLILTAGVMAIGVPAPNPGSVSIKYSAAVIFPAAAGAAGYSGSCAFENTLHTSNTIVYKYFFM